MNKGIKLLAITAIAFGLGVAASNYAISDVPSNYKVAVIDVKKVVESSNQVKALTKDRAKQGDELAKFVKTANAAIEKEKDAKKKKVLEEKYRKELKAKQETIAKNYETKLLEIDKNISSLIDTKAKAQGYNLVLAKGVVLSGGTDITDEISKEVK